MGMVYCWVRCNLAMEKMIIKAQCRRCGKLNRYEEKDWFGRENTICTRCHKPLTITSGFIYDSMEKEEFEEFMKICGMKKTINNQQLLQGISKC